MENGKKPASPIVNSEGFVTHQSKLERETQQQLLSGLDKREHFAGLAMQGLLANQNGGMQKGGGTTFSPIGIAELAVLHADAVLAELEKTQKQWKQQ